MMLHIPLLAATPASGPNGIWDSGLQQPDVDFVFIATNPGTFDYFLHGSSMDGWSISNFTSDSDTFERLLKNLELLLITLYQ